MYHLNKEETIEEKNQSNLFSAALYQNLQESKGLEKGQNLGK